MWLIQHERAYHYVVSKAFQMGPYMVCNRTSHRFSDSRSYKECRAGVRGGPAIWPCWLARKSLPVHPALRMLSSFWFSCLLQAIAEAMLEEIIIAALHWRGCLCRWPAVCLLHRRLGAGGALRSPDVVPQSRARTCPAEACGCRASGTPCARSTRRAPHPTPPPTHTHAPARSRALAHFLRASTRPSPIAASPQVAPSSPDLPAPPSSPPRRPPTRHATFDLYIAGAVPHRALCALALGARHPRRVAHRRHSPVVLGTRRAARPRGTRRARGRHAPRRRPAQRCAADCAPGQPGGPRQRREGVGLWRNAQGRHCCNHGRHGIGGLAPG
eukprot:363309-Chlamydomonas_euryale.AAC.28